MLKHLGLALDALEASWALQLTKWRCTHQLRIVKCRLSIGNDSA